jgi:cytochrome b subunit of formate dehydrogenase
MANAFALIFIALWHVLRAFGFVLKIVATYFVNCARQVTDKIHDEWINRELDDEIY